MKDDTIDGPARPATDVAKVAPGRETGDRALQLEGKVDKANGKIGDVITRAPKVLRDLRTLN